jgi:2'-5' RNA ligase
VSDARYAIYYAPEPATPLAAFGRRWLDELGPVCCPAAVAAPRRYGFHATLKAPFRLARDRTAEQLEAALTGFAGRRQPFIAPALCLDELDGFLALRPSAPTRALGALAEDALRSFDHFRAPAGAEELLRRGEGLANRQAELLSFWGYPYVLDEYRFHMTLTDRLDDDVRNRLRAVLEPMVAVIEDEPLAVESVCLFVQSSPAEAFQLRRRFAFAA